MTRLPPLIWMLLAPLLIALPIGGCAPKKIIVSSPTGQRPPSLEADAYEQAEQLYQQAKFERALTAFNQYLQQFPAGERAPEALARIGAIHNARAEKARAREAWRRLLRDYPQSPASGEAATALLESLAAEGRHGEVLAAAKEIRLEAVAPERTAHLLAIMAEAHLAQHQPLAAANLLAQALPMAASSERDALRSRLRAVLEMLDPEARRQVLARIGDPQLAPPAAVEKPHIAPPTAIRHVAIGCVLPLSGGYESFGRRALRGVELALTQFNSRAQTPVELAMRDTGSNPTQSAKAVRELAADGRIMAVLGPISTPETAAAEAREAALPIVVLSQKESLPGSGEYVFNNFFTQRMQARAVAAYAIDTLNLKRFAVLYPDETYGRSLTTLFQEEIQSRGARLVAAESYGPQQTDLSGPIRRLNTAAGQDSQGFEALYIPDTPGKVVLILPQLAYHNLQDKTLLGTNLWHQESLIQMGQPYVHNAIFPDAFFAGSTRSNVTAFVSSFRAVYGEEPDVIAAVAYDSAMMLFATATRASVKGRAELRNALAENYRFEGVTGMTSYGHGGELKKRMYILGVRQDRFVELASPF